MSEYRLTAQRVASASPKNLRVIFLLPDATTYEVDDANTDAPGPVETIPGTHDPALVSVKLIDVTAGGAPPLSVYGGPTGPPVISAPYKAGSGPDWYVNVSVPMEFLTSERAWQVTAFARPVWTDFGPTRATALGGSLSSGRLQLNTDAGQGAPGTRTLTRAFKVGDWFGADAPDTTIIGVQVQTKPSFNPTYAPDTEYDLYSAAFPQDDPLGLMGVTDPENRCTWYWGPKIASTAGDEYDEPLAPLGVTGPNTWTYPDATHIARAELTPAGYRWSFDASGTSTFDDVIYDLLWTAVQATRQYPRDDGAGLSAAPRLYPPPKARRIVGGYQ